MLNCLPSRKQCDKIKYINKRRKIMSEKKKMPALLLCFFLGVFGAHRFYVGKTGSAVAMLLISLLTGWAVVGFVVTWVWAIIDFIMICMNKFTDKEGKVLATDAPAAPAA
jgi:TM2 domain-containing membrane protein YozV